MSALKPNVSQFPIIFFNLSAYSILLNHMSSQGVFSKDIYHGTEMIYDTKTISCTIRATLRKDNLNLLKKQNAAQLPVMEKSIVKLLHYHTYSMRSYFKKISRISLIPPPGQKPRIPTFFFYPNIPYPDRFSAFWLRLVSRETSTVKYHCTTYGTFFSAIRGRHSYCTVSTVCLFSREAITRVFWFVFDSFLFTSSVES